MQFDAYSGAAAFNAIAYAPKHQGTLAALQREGERFGHVFAQVGQGFFTPLEEVYDRFNGAEAMRMARATVNKIKGLFKKDIVRSMWDVSEMQQATPMMQRFIMAEPTVRALYHRQGCDGFSPTYVDMYPDAVGVNHYDYRQVKNAIVQELPPDENGEGDWKVQFFFDDLVEGDRELTLDEKSDILSTWDMVRAIVEQGDDDPTSPFAGKL